jgi:hypothetical protein
MDNFNIDENYIVQNKREESPTEIFNSHLCTRDDDPNDEIQGVLDSMKRDQPEAFTHTQEVIQNFIIDAFDEGGRLFRDSSSQAGTIINTVYGKLREVAFKHLLKTTKNYDAKTRAQAKIYFIHKVDGEIFKRVRKEAVVHYKEQLANGLIPLPGEIKQFEKLIKKYEISQKLYQCIAEWYVEAEVSIDLIRRIQMYGIFEDGKNRVIYDKLKKAWELKSNYYIDVQAAFLSMI